MKNLIISFITIAVVAAILEQFLPWWSIAIAGLAIGYFVKQQGFMAFLGGFAAIFLLWTAYAFFISQANHNILAAKVAELLPLKGHVKYLLLVTGLVGGLVGGFSALTGSLAARLSSNSVSS
jgi:hypothetical protein